MRAATVDEPGATARYGDFADPEPVEGESALTVLAAGIHPIVRSLAAGTHYGSGAAYPIIPGVDCVARDARGTVRYAGDIRAPWGTLAEQVAARMGVPVPEGTDPVQVAAAMNPGLSSWLPLVDRQRTRGRLGTVVIIGATGVAGRVAVQNALALGADRVVGLGRDAGRLAEVAALGGRPIALGDGAGALRRALEGDPPSLILDYLWGCAAELAWESLGGRGLDEDEADIVHVQLGTAAGPYAALPGSLLRSRRITVRGSGAGSASMREVLEQLPVYLGRIASGEVLAPVRVFPLSRVHEAWTYAGPERAVVVPD